MTCIVAVYNAKGKAISYCGARCYNAKPVSLCDTPCVCICGGKNHAQGEMHAFKNYQKGIPLRCEDLEAFAKSRDLDPKTLTIIDRLRVPTKHAPKRALAQLTKPKPLPLFAYGFVGHRKPTEGAQRRRG